MLINEKKEIFRAYAKRALKTDAARRPKCAHTALARQTARLVSNLISNLNRKNVLLFAPLFYEPDLLAFRRYLCQKKCKLFLPFMVDESLKMVKLRLPFSRAKFGVREAGDSLAHTGAADVAVIPVIGADASLARIGHGKGYYDRFIGSLPRRPIIIFVSIKDLFSNLKLCEPHDIRCDFYITPTKKYLKVKNDRSHRGRVLHCGGRGNWVFCR